MFPQSLLQTETRKIDRMVGDLGKIEYGVFCKMPVALFTELTKTSFEYFSTLRGEWCMLFNQIAEHQIIIAGPKWIVKSFKPTKSFVQVMDLLVWPKKKQYVKDIEATKVKVARMLYPNAKGSSICCHQINSTANRNPKYKISQKNQSI